MASPCMGLLTHPCTATATSAAALVQAVTTVPASASDPSAAGPSATAPPAAARTSASRASPPDCGRRTPVRWALRTLTDDDRLAGAAVEVTDPVCGRWSAATGTADLGTGRPLNARDRLRAGSAVALNQVPPTQGVYRKWISSVR